MGIVDEFVKALKPTNKERPKAYSAEVSKIDDEGVVWVYLAGSEAETPTALSSSEVKAGDSVNVEWRNNKLYIAGNTSNPSAGVVRVQNVEQAAQVANELAVDASNSANIARTAAESAVASATEAAEAAESAQESATNASEYASRALGNLSTVQSVTETLNWITAHGTMTLTSDTALDPTHVYFVVDQSGDYEVGGTHYSVVTEPDAADISTYYELSIDESLNNYVGTHLAVTSEGLWLLPDAGGNKVLIATGQGSTYTSAGTYIIGKVNNVDTVLASFLADGGQIGQDANTHAVIDYHSLQLIAKEGRIFFHVSDLRNQEGIATLTDYFYGDGTTTQFTFSINQVVAVIEVSIDDVAQEEGVDYTFTSSSITFTTAPSDEASIVVTYESTSTTAKAFTFGIRRSGSAVGAYSFVHGYQCRATGAYSHAEGSYATANGQYSHSEGSESRARGRASHAEGSGQANAYLSHAEGLNSKANGQYSHSEGYYAQANGNGSHAEGEYSIADGAYQTVIGRNNVADTTSAFIIGNGTNYDARRNAFQIGWDNGVRVGLDTSVSNVNDYALYQAITALGWQNDVID